MKFQLGDLVVLKHTGAEGKISSLEKDGMYRVHIDGMDIPVFKEDLDHPYFDWFTKERDRKKQLKSVRADQIPAETSRSPGHGLARGAYLAFFPVYGAQGVDEILKFRIYIINQQKETIHFSYKVKMKQEKLFEIKAEVLGFANFYVHDVAMEVMHESPSFYFRTYEDAGKKTAKSIEQEIKLRPKRLFEYLSELERGHIAFFHIYLEQHAAEEVFAAGKEIKFKSAAGISTSSTKAHPEVDLHIEKLANDWKHLSNAEILEIQLRACDYALSNAIGAGAESLTIIHGVGKGVLKNEIHSLLRSQAEVRYFICDWMPRYGHGATQVFF